MSNGFSDFLGAVQQFGQGYMNGRQMHEAQQETRRKAIEEQLVRLDSLLQHNQISRDDWHRAAGRMIADYGGNPADYGVDGHLPPEGTPSAPASANDQDAQTDQSQPSPADAVGGASTPAGDSTPGTYSSTNSPSSAPTEGDGSGRGGSEEPYFNFHLPSMGEGVDGLVNYLRAGRGKWPPNANDVLGFVGSLSSYGPSSGSSGARTYGYGSSQENGYDPYGL